MADTSALERQISSSQRSADSARRQAHALESQLSSVRAEIARLEREKSDLESFRGRVGRDGDSVRQQLQTRRRILNQIGEIKDVQLAQELAKAISSNEMANAGTILGRGISDATEEVRRGIKRLIGQLNELRRREASLVGQINAQYSLASQYDLRAQSASRELERARRDSEGS